MKVKQNSIAAAGLAIMAMCYGIVGYAQLAAGNAACHVLNHHVGVGNHILTSTDQMTMLGSFRANLGIIVGDRVSLSTLTR